MLVPLGTWCIFTEMEVMIFGNMISNIFRFIIKQSTTLKMDASTAHLWKKLAMFRNGIWNFRSIMLFSILPIWRYHNICDCKMNKSIKKLKFPLLILFYLDIFPCFEIWAAIVHLYCIFLFIWANMVCVCILRITSILFILLETLLFYFL